MNLNVLLAVPVVLPLLGAGILLAFPAKRFRHLQAFSAIGVLVIVLAAAIALLIALLVILDYPFRGHQNVSPDPIVRALAHIRQY